MDLCEYISDSRRIKHLGHGEFGEVYLHQGLDGKNFVIKRISNQSIRKYGLGPVIREINVLSALKSCPDATELYGVCFRIHESEDMAVDSVTGQSPVRGPASGQPLAVDSVTGQSPVRGPASGQPLAVDPVTGQSPVRGGASGQPLAVDLYFEVDIVMEPLDGDIEDLDLTSDIAPELVRSVISTLAAMEQLGLYHNDIHEGNIFYKLTPNGYRFKLGDFGLSSFNPVEVGQDDLVNLFYLYEPDFDDDPWLISTFKKIKESKEKVSPSSLVIPCSVQPVRESITERWSKIRQLSSDDLRAITEVQKALTGDDVIDLSLFQNISDMIVDLEGRLA